jgi:hypothetical protein
MPFYKYFGTSLAVATTSSTSMLESPSLTQPDHFWEGSWLLATKVAGTAAEDSREIISFVSHVNRLVLERSITGLAVADTFELLTGWTAGEVHDAINRAIEQAFPFFFDTIIDDTVVLSESALSYDISGLTIKPWKVMGLWVEQPTSTASGVPQTAAGTTITLASTYSNADMQTNPTHYTINIWDGKGAGQSRTPSAYNNTTKIATVTTWTTTPDTTSKYMVYDITDQEVDWKRIEAIRTDSKDWPSTLYLTQRYSGYEGFRLRIQYLSKPALLTLDASTTIVPPEYILLKAIALLSKMRVPNNRYDRARYGQMAADYEKEAKEYLQSNMWQPTPGTIWGESDVSGGRFSSPDGDPLGWGR